MKFLILIIIFFISIGLKAQNYTVYGNVKDEKTGEDLIGVNVYEKSTNKGVVSNSYGFYSFKLTSNKNLTICFSYVGYTTKEQTISLNKDTNLTVNLVPGSLLEEVTVYSKSPIENRNEIGVVRLSNKNIYQIPNIAGEADVMRAYQLMPGIQGGSEGTTGLHVRGGSTDQNLVIIDEVPLYYVNHLGGFVSTFNPDIINNAELIKGGFPARYGGRLSSVLDIKMKEGNMKEFHSSWNIGLISSKAMIEGPFIKDKASYIISVRRFMYDLLTRPLSKLVFDGVSVGYTFYDINAKMNYYISAKERLFLSYYKGNDGYIAKLNDDYSSFSSGSKWGNELGALRWNHIFNTRFFSNTTFTVSKYKHLTGFEGENKESGLTNSNMNSFHTSILDSRLKVNFEYSITNNYNIRFGPNLVYHTFEPGVTIFKIVDEISYDTIFGQKTINAFEKSAFIENDLNFDRFGVNLGGRFTQYTIDNKHFNSFEPRALCRINTTDKSSIKFAYSEMKQYIHLVSYGGVGLPANYWLPATKKVSPSTSEQFSLGYFQTIRSIEVSAEGYYKEMDNLTNFSEGSSFFGSSTDWQDKLETDGIGKAYGVEFLLKKNHGKTNGWISYTLAKNERKFNTINNGEWTPYQYDRRHDINIVLVRQINEKLDLSITWEYNSGRPITVAAGWYNAIEHPGDFYGDDFENVHSFNDEEDYIPDEYVDIYEGINTFRMKAFHKLDVGMNYKKQKKKKEVIWNFSIYNVYNRQNPFYYYWDYSYTNGNEVSDEYKLYQMSLFPIIPSVSYSVKF